MNKFLKISLWALLLSSFAMTLNSCKKDFDAPPGPGDPLIVANTTIAQLKAMHLAAGAYDIITTDVVIEGVVVANDRSGNLYKQIFIEDSTGGMQVLLDAVSLFNTYPVGRKVFIRCKDLCISDFNNTPQLGVKATVAGVPSFEGIPGALISKYVVGGSINNPVVPHLLSYTALKNASNNLAKPWFNRYLNTLIQLDSMAFVGLNRPYSDTSVYKATVNRGVRNCTAASGDSIIVRNSAYANFAARSVPEGRGKITSVYTVFGTTRQLLLRDSTDIQFTNPYACAAVPLPPGTLLFEDFESIGANNATLSLPNWKNIGEVGNVLYQNALFGPVKCAKITAFGTSAPAAVTSWLITPSVNLTGATAPKLSFLNAAGFAVGPTSFKVLISTNYTGSNTPSTATWTELTANWATPPATGFSDFVSSGIINLSAYIGQNVHIAFKYVGGNPTATTTWEVDDVRVTSL